MKRDICRPSTGLEMALVGHADARAAYRLVGGALRAHAGIEQGEPGHALGRDLHDLDGDHAAQREAGEREFLRWRLGQTQRAVASHESQIAGGACRQSGTTISAASFSAANCGAYRRGEQSRPGINSSGVFAMVISSTARA